MTRTATTLRRVRSHLFARHRRGYAGIVGVAAVTGAIVAASLNALQVAGAAHRSTGVPYQAVQWNVLIDLMASFNGLVVGMGALTAAVLLASVASFALEPRIPELARLSLVGMTRMDLLRLTVGELVAAVLAGTALGAALGVPASFGLLAAERASAMTPQGLEPRLMPASFLAAALVTMVAGLVGGLLPVLRVAGTAPPVAAGGGAVPSRSSCWCWCFCSPSPLSPRSPPMWRLCFSSRRSPFWSSSTAGSSSLPSPVSCGSCPVRGAAPAPSSPCPMRRAAVPGR